jgi:uncharacterized protein involved in outer membrane biogenesis
MQRKVPVTVIILGLLGVAYLLASLTLSNLLSPERLRIMLVEPVEDQLGRKIEIGTIKVSLFSGIDIKDIVVREKNPAQEFITIANFRLHYELLPLLEKRLVIKEVLIDKPTIKITRNAQGVFNFADLSLKPKKIQKEIPPPELQSAKPLPLTLVFDQIKINDLNLTFADQTGELPAITSTDGDLSLAVTLGNTLAEAKYQGSLDLIVSTELNGSKPVLLIKSEVSDQLITFRGELNVEFDKLQFNGQLANQLTTPDLTLDLQGATLDLEKLAGLKPAGQRQGGKPAPAAPALAAPAPATPQPGAKKFRAHGKISVNELHHGKLALQNLNLIYSFADNIVEITNLSAGFLGGSISGKAGLELGRPAPAFRGQLKADKLQMAAAMEALNKPQGYLTGELSGDFSGRGAGGGWPEIRNNLDGQGRFVVVKGGLASSPISQALAALLGIPELDNLKFDKLSATAKIAGGRAALDSSLTSKVLNLQTKGSAGLDGSLDLPLVLQLSPEYSRRLQEKASFTRYLAGPSGRTTLNLKLKGTVDHPDLSLSGEGAGHQIKNALGKKAGEELSRSLSKKLGGLDSQSQGAVEETTGRLFKQLLGN